MIISPRARRWWLAPRFILASRRRRSPVLHTTTLASQHSIRFKRPPRPDTVARWLAALELRAESFDHENGKLDSFIVFRSGFGRKRIVGGVPSEVGKRVWKLGIGWSEGDMLVIG